MDNTSAYSFKVSSVFPNRAIIRLGRADGKPFVGDRLCRIELPGRPVLWQRSIQTGEFHNVEPVQAAAWEACFQAADKPQWEARHEALTMGVAV